MESRIYYDDPDVIEWEAEVIDVIEENGVYHIALSKTALYPGGGGQPADKGSIDGIPVEGAYEKDDRAYYVLKARPKSGVVRCIIDRAYRKDLMRQHTGQHILSSVFDAYGGETSSFHLGDEEVSIEISLPDIGPEMLKVVEDKANDIVMGDLPVISHIVTQERANEFSLRKKPPQGDTIRIVDIGGIDFSACCGTHVRRTGEVGIIKIIKAEKTRKQTKVWFKCGSRALMDYQEKHETVMSLSKHYKVPESEVLSRNEAAALQLKELQRELIAVKEKLLVIEAHDIMKSANGKIIRKDFEDKKSADVSFMAKIILDNGSFVLILSSIPEKRLILAHDGEFILDCGKLFKEHLSAFNGKGGGGNKWANAGFTELEDMKKFEDFLMEHITG